MDNEVDYANIVKIANVSELLSTGQSLQQLLKTDKEEVEVSDENNFWYHKKISRESAEEILQEGMQKHFNVNGLFLIRDSTVSNNDYALSIVCKGKIFHFQIQQKCETFYHIEQGPVIHGLDRLVTHYTNSPNGLPTKLTSFCRGSNPPSSCRKFGPTNILHRAVLEGKIEVVKKILPLSMCPDVDAKNELGSLALHDAAYHGYYDIVSLLLDRSADVKIKDKNGHTALHRACVNNKPQIVDLIIQKGPRVVSERCSQTGWVALHEAAMRGHINCVKVLLEHDATPFPRNDDHETPLDLSDKYRRKDCVKLFNAYQLPNLPTMQCDWFHPEVDRQGALKMFEVHGMREGLFLVRPSMKHPGWNVLSLCHSRTAFNYEIRNLDYRNRLVHYIDDGPYLLSLEHVVYHYSNEMDGLPCVLQASLNTNNKMRDVIVGKSTQGNHPSEKLIYERPNLPPRPMVDDLYTAPNKNKPPTTSHISPPDPNGLSPPVPSGPPPIHPKTEPEKKQVSEKKPEPTASDKLATTTVIYFKDIKIGRELGQGEYGSVLKGTLITRRGTFQNKKIDVALKTFRNGSVENANSFLDEAKVMQSLQHDCILQLFGVCEGPPLMLVEEYMPMGSMLDFLLDHVDEIDVETDLYLWAAQIASGMKYLETKRLVHRDLAARNILLKSKKQIKISDFGLSRAVGTESDYYKATHGGRWPIKWYAPESVNYGQFSHASDVWSYGITLWEMFTFGEPPYGEMKGIEVVQFIEGGRRLAQPEKCPEMVYLTMKQCWNWKPELRPDFRKLADDFYEDPKYACIQDVLGQH